MAVFVLIYRLRELPLSAVTNCSDLRCEPKLLCYKSCPVGHNMENPNQPAVRKFR